MIEALSKLNFRDIGGLPAGDGLRTRAGLVFRSEGPASFGDVHRDELGSLAFRTVCDLRAAVERDAAPNDWCGEGARLLHLDMSTDLRVAGNAGWEALRSDPSAGGARESMRANYQAMPAALLPYLRVLVDAVIRDGTPLLVHCTAGKDRTGVAIAVLLGAVGVPRREIVADYLRSDIFGENTRIGGSVIHAFEETFGFTPSQATIDVIIGVDPAFLDTAFDAIDTGWGGMDAYLEAAGIDDDRVAELHERLLVAAEV